METATAQRWKRRKEARPQEILEAALAVFAEKGLSAARMDDIAARAGVTKGTIYLYFPSKNDVFKALLSATVSERLKIVGTMIERYEGATPDLLANVIRFAGGILTSSDLAALPKIVIAEIAKFPELLRYYRAEVIDRALGFWKSILKRGIARGEFREGISLDHTARLCVAPLLLAAIWRTTFDEIGKEPYDINGLIETHINVLLKGLAADGGAKR
jgi:AcrR family transcriptional regulator